MTVELKNGRIRVELGLTIEKGGTYVKGMVALEVEIPDGIDIDEYGQELTDQVLSVLEDSIIETHLASLELK